MSRSLSVILGFAFAFAASGCSYHPVDLPQVLASGETIRVACVGDSLTLTGGTNAYPALLQRRLGSQWSFADYAMGQTAVLKIGDNPILLSDNFQAALDSNPHAVIVLLGTNDSKPRHWYYRKQFVRDYNWMVRKLKGIPSRPVIWIALPPPAFPGQWGIRDEVIRDGIIPELRKIAGRHGLPVIDLYEVFRGRADLFPDQIHPNDEGVRIMADTFEAVLKEAVEPAGS